MKPAPADMDHSTRRDIEAECARLVVAFGRHRDYREADAIAAMISQDCEWHRDGELVKGQQAIRLAVEAMTGELVLRHVLTNILVDVLDADHAASIAYYTVYRHHLAGDAAGTDLPRPFRAPQRVGDYRMGFIREDGRWLVSYASAARVFEFDPS